jgi:O-antigen ligase
LPDAQASLSGTALTVATIKRFDSAIWPALFIVLLAAGWLLPNHYPPWTTFHLDAWVAAVLSIGSLVVIWRTSDPIPLYPSTVWVAVLALIPGLQYGAGLLATSGNAWVCTAYLLGLALALITGARWESLRAGHLANCLFSAIGIAAIASVGLQLHQWLTLDGLELWSMGSDILRPHANFGQPNQLATFLLWGLLALAWGFLRGKIGPLVAVFAASFFLFGIALASSRTAWVGLAIMVLACWYWRRCMPSRRLPWVVTGLAIGFFLLVAAMPDIDRALLLTDEVNAIDIAGRLGRESRPQIWALFLDAAWQKPWLGYGWNQVALADMAAADRHQALHTYFGHSHNLFLDVALWCGIPLGLVLTAVSLIWFWRRFRSVDSAENVVLFLFLLVVANHAMLELPLHHAYLLLPFGLVMGILDARSKQLPLTRVPRGFVMALWLSAFLLLSVIVRDYLRVEASYQALRFEWSRLKSPPAKIPDVLILNQWPDFFRLVKLSPRPGMSEAELTALRYTAALNPGAGSLQTLAIALARNGRPEEAALWLRRMCKTASAFQCELVKKAWLKDAQNLPEIAAVPWPS